MIPVLCAFVCGKLFGTEGILASAAIGKLLILLLVFIGNCVFNKGLPKGWTDIMFLPKGFGGSDQDNVYA